MATFKLLLLALASLSGISLASLLPTGYDWLFTMTNSPLENSLVAYIRRSNGTLDFHSSFSTGGKGGATGLATDPLASQSSIIVHQGKCIFLVNAGSDNISSYRISGKTLVKVGLIGSGGTFPVSLAARGTSLFVLNAGGRGAISGYNINSTCGLTEKLTSSIRDLNQGQTNPPSSSLRPAR